MTKIMAHIIRPDAGEMTGAGFNERRRQSRKKPALFSEGMMYGERGAYGYPIESFLIHNPCDPETTKTIKRIAQLI